MNLQSITGIYANDIHVKEIAAGISLREPKLRVNIKNMIGSNFTFLSHAVWKTAQSNHVFVLPDKEQAAYFQNDFEHISDALDIFYFPDSFKKEGNFHLLNSSNIMLRTEALSKIQDNTHRKVLVTSPEGLFEKVVHHKALTGNMIHIKSGDNLDTDTLLSRLVDLGFRHESFVYEPGQFALRGGILDIYSYGNEHPYRIELFGKEVDSIRLFDPETQLSVKKLVQVSIIPNIETQFSSRDRISILDYLPDNTVFWFRDYEYAMEKLRVLSEKLKDQLVRERSEFEASEEQWVKEMQVEDFEDTDSFIEKLKRRHVINWSGKDMTLDDYPAATIEWQSEEQPVFNRNFQLLIADLQQRTRNNYTCYIFAENARQLERLRSIFEDAQALVDFVPVPISVTKGFIDHKYKLVCYTDHQIFQRFHKYKVKQSYTKGKAITLKALRELQPGDYVTHIDHGVGQFSGLQKIEVNGNMQEAVRIIYRDNDVLYVNINSLHKISKYTGKEGVTPRINKLGSDAWEKLKNKTKKQVKDIATDLIRLYAKRKASHGFAHAPDTYLQVELESSFLYEDTPDQSKAVADVKRDMESPAPMDRLVCGDVGFGKTEVAVRAAFKTVNDSKQAAILVPTTILAYQHYKTFSDRLKDFPVNIDYLNRFKSAKEKKETLKKLEEGKIDIIVGTHALLAKDVKFRDLGLLIIDEEQKFGVAAKEKLRERKSNVDTLTLTATPIPRTLQFSLMSARDLSIINTPPPNRQPIHTELMGFNELAIRDAIYYEVERGGQVYFVHNRVQSLDSMARKLKDLCPDVEFAVAHGQMEGAKLEKVLLDFINHKFDVLVCTNIVESGVDISNANTIFVNNAHQFGLSDLHQLRGRVGRSNKKAFCYLMAPSLLTLPETSRKRLQALEQFNELGSGFQIAMRDLDIRGAGNILGGEQSGFITEIGFDMYQKILAEAIRELKSTDFKEVFAEEQERVKDFVSDCTIDTDLEIMIPDSYVDHITERLSLYTQLDNIEDDAALEAFRQQLEDRFGPVPVQVEDLFTTIRCRRIAKLLGFEKLFLKNNTLRLYFVSDPESSYFESATFNNIMNFLQTGTNKARLKQVGKNFMLIVSDMKSMQEIYDFLDHMQHYQ
ncbi:MAG: transcription-repair coupling factor [Bacteroidetes bacterium 47-18]|nr:MAG: transcription-repair coupling factor [Bacteroidetes bacterium 47-18]